MEKCWLVDADSFCLGVPGMLTYLASSHLAFKNLLNFESFFSSFMTVTSFMLCQSKTVYMLRLYSQGPVSLQFSYFNCLAALALIQAHKK